MMNKRIMFSYDITETVTTGETVKEQDGSIIYQPDVPIGPFSIHLFNWAFEITTERRTDCLYLLKYCIGNLDYMQYELTHLQVPQAICGRVFVSLNFPHADGVYYSEYEPFLKKYYYDPEKRILATGDIHRDGQCVEFIQGQYVVLDDCKRLVAIYVVFSG